MPVPAACSLNRHLMLHRMNDPNVSTITHTMRVMYHGKFMRCIMSKQQMKEVMLMVNVANRCLRSLAMSGVK